MTIPPKDPSIFINEELDKVLDFELMDFEFFLNLTNLTDSSKDIIRLILMETKRVPAALKGYHGDYEGGLFDHILLVTNLVFQICEDEKVLSKYRSELQKKGVAISENYSDIDLPQALLSAIYHDFGKVPYYSFKLDLTSRVISTTKYQREEVSIEITDKFHFKGYDSHVDECISVLKNYRLPFNDEIYKAIIFHHGKWSYYKPFKPTKLSELIHIADMIASQIYFI